MVGQNYPRLALQIVARFSMLFPPAFTLQAFAAKAVHVVSDFLLLRSMVGRRQTGRLRLGEQLVGFLNCFAVGHCHFRFKR
jgi:hypothetical protein